MIAHRPLPLPAPTRTPAPPDRALLERLRTASRTCRAQSRVDACRDCAAPGAGIGSCLCALVATAPQATGRHLTIYRPDEAEISFDESWLLALIEAAARGDGDSLRFLIARRVAPSSHARIALLARRVADTRADARTVLT